MQEVNCSEEVIRVCGAVKETAEKGRWSEMKQDTRRHDGARRESRLLKRKRKGRVHEQACGSKQERLDPWEA